MTNRTMTDFTNFRKSVACSDPTTPASNDHVRLGALVGAAMKAENADGNTSTDFGPLEMEVSVKGVDDTGNVAVAVGDFLYRVDGDAFLSKKKLSGYFAGIALEAVSSGATATKKVLKPLQVLPRAYRGRIDLNITVPRIISGGAIQNTTEAGVPDGNTNPSLARVNGATDPALRLAWAASNVTEIQFEPIPYPPDLDDTQDVIVNVLAAMAGTTDTPTLTFAAFEGVGDTDMGGATAAVTGTAVAKYSRTLAAANIGAYPNVLNLSLTPGAHGTDILYVYAVWIEYTRKQ